MKEAEPLSPKEMAIVRRALAAMPNDVMPQKRRSKFAVAGVNKPCPCGSGKKFKRCCMGKRSK